MIVENEVGLHLTAEMIRKGREPHSIIICGEQGLGKKTIAREIAAQLLCENQNGSPCGICRHCRLLKNNTHPDFITVNSSESGNYKVEDIRAITADAVVSPNEGRFKIYLVPDLDRSVQTLTQVQNIMLKLIEEPPDSTVIILTARSKEIFLDTIISRTLILTAEEVSSANAYAYLIKKGIDEKLCEEAVRRCGGNIGKCLCYATDEKQREIADLAVSAAEAVADSKEYNLLLALSRCDGKKVSFIAMLGFMQRIFRDASRLRAGVDTPMLFSVTVCKKLSVSCSQKRLADIYDILGEYSRRASANCLISTLTNALAAKINS